MQVNRRSFIAGSAATAGLAAPGMAEPVKVKLPFGPPAKHIQLSRNENPYGPAPSAVQAIADTASKGCYYADSGKQWLTQMIAERNRVDPTQVVIGSGSTELLSAAALAWGSMGKIVCPSLFWDTTVQYGERQGVEVIRVPLAEDMNVDASAMLAAVGEGVSMVQICNPNNPTGMVIDNAALREIAMQVTPKATLLIDEAYNELTDSPESETLVDLVRDGHDVIVCRTFSKIYGMAGMRVGYAITSPANAQRIESYIMSFGGNVSGLAAAIASYNDMTFLERSKAMVMEGREMILDAVARSGTTALPSQTNFVYVVVPDANAVQAAMAERGIFIRGAYGAWSQYSRVSTGILEDVEKYAAALPEVIATIKT